MKKQTIKSKPLTARLFSRVSEAQKLKLEKYAIQNKTSISELIREQLDNILT